MSEPALDDARASGPVERLLEESWDTRSRQVGRRELAVESAAAILFLACATPLALAAVASHRVDILLAAELACLYALATRIRFPIGAGYVVPSYLVLVQMLLLLPSGLVPLLAAASMVAATVGQVLARRVKRERVLSSIPDAWHTLGPAIVLVAAGSGHTGVSQLLVYGGAFSAGCALDLVSAVIREAAILGIKSRVQLRVAALVWLIDACFTPLGFVFAWTARSHPAYVLLILPLNGLLLLLSRDRDTRIVQAQRRLDLVAHERARLQTAVRRLGDALSAKLDMDALTTIVLRGSVEALDADGGRLTLGGSPEERVIEIDGTPRIERALQAAGERAEAEERSCQLECEGVWALALPFSFDSGAGRTSGALSVARADRAFQHDEEAVLHDLVERARQAAADIVAHNLLREQAFTDALTKLGNRRKLAIDLDERLPGASATRPLVLILLDLDGFKHYNDTFGHLAGDTVLARLGAKLSAAVAEHGTAYRLGGDEFCALLAVQSTDLDAVVAAAAGALEERGENFAVSASYGAVLIPHEASGLDYALQLADERMYARKKVRPSAAGDQAREMLIRIMQAKQPSLEDHASGVSVLCRRVGRHFGMSGEELDELVRAAELHDVGKVGVPDAILDKAGALSAEEREFVRQHTLLGERILSAAPALRPVAVIVRASHERWDGRGYPDGLAGEEIPLGARIIAACDAYEAMVSDRCYRKGMSHEAACEELRREAGRQFDADIVDVLIEELCADADAEGPAVTEPSALAARAAEVAASLRKVLVGSAPVAAALPARGLELPAATDGAGGGGSAAPRAL